MKPPHSRRPGASASGQGPADRPLAERTPSNRGASGRGPSDRGIGGKASDAPRFQRGGETHSVPERAGKPGGFQKRRADVHGVSPQPERPRSERTLTFRPVAERDGGKPEPPRLPRASSARPALERPRRNAAPHADPDAPRGALWLYGTHAVAAALANPSRRLRRLLLTEEAEAAISARQPQPWPVTPERSDRARLDTLLGRDAVHQGAALLADPLSPPALSAAMERPGPLLVLDQVSDPRNIGAILRAAAAFGVAAVIVQDRNAPEETGALAKAASGALETMPLLRAVNLARTLVALKAAGCWVIGLDAGGAVLSGAALAERRVALVLGNEGDGLRRLTRDTCDEIAAIAMPGRGGGLDSLNVAAAAAVALYELGRR